MPTYTFVCETCETIIEKEIPMVLFGRQHGKKEFFKCEKCESDLKLKFSSVGIQFKGDGFAKNDRNK